MKVSVTRPFRPDFLYYCNSIIKTAKHEIKCGLGNKNVTCLICFKQLTFDAFNNIIMLIPITQLYFTVSRNKGL